MRIRKKKHLEERVKSAGEYLIVADYDILNSDLARRDKRYFNFFDMFGNANPVELEVGCGKGGFICEKAIKNPDVNYIAVELLQNIAVMAAENVKNRGASNVRIFNCGADYLARYIPPSSLSAIYLNFSPPFSGKRYENRRLTKAALVNDYNDFLISGGIVYQKTDDKAFFDFSAETLKENGFTVEFICSDEKDNIKTEYEKKFRALGMPIYALRAVKKD